MTNINKNCFLQNKENISFVSFIFFYCFT